MRRRAAGQQKPFCASNLEQCSAPREGTAPRLGRGTSQSGQSSTRAAVHNHPRRLHPSSSATPPTLLMPDQPRTAIIMVCQTGGDDGRGLPAACTARELNVLSGLPPFNWSPSVASAERHRCALPCGKASTGCRASLRTSCWTRSVRDRLRCARSNAETAAGFQTMCPLHWSRPVTRAGRGRRVLLRSSALDGCAALLRMSPSALPPR